MVKIIATTPFPYGKHRYAAGDEVEVSAKDAKLLIGINRARPFEAAKPTPATLAIKAPEPVVEPEVEAVEPEAAPEAPPHPSQAYHRRDMSAESPAGQTGQAASSPLSHRGRPRGPRA